MFFINCKPCKSLRECWLLGSAWLKITAIYSWCFILNHFYTTQLSQVNNLLSFSHTLAHQSPLTAAATFKGKKLFIPWTLGAKLLHSVWHLERLELEGAYVTLWPVWFFLTFPILWRIPYSDAFEMDMQH